MKKFITVDTHRVMVVWLLKQSNSGCTSQVIASSKEMLCVNVEGREVVVVGRWVLVFAEVLGHMPMKAY